MHTHISTCCQTRLQNYLQISHPKPPKYTTNHRSYNMYNNFISRKRKNSFKSMEGKWDGNLNLKGFILCLLALQIRQHVHQVQSLNTLTIKNLHTFANNLIPYKLQV